MGTSKFLQDNWKAILTVIIVIILIYVLKQNWDKIKHIFQARSVQTVAGESTNISADRKNYINSLGSGLYNDLYHTSILGHTEELYTKALGLSDTELIYLSQYYRSYLSRGNSLYKDLSNDYFLPGSDGDKLQVRLSQVGEQ